MSNETMTDDIAGWLAREMPAALSMIGWQSPDTTPDVSPGSYDWFWVAVERHGHVVSHPATYLNAMPLDRDDTNPIERAESGSHWRHEPLGEDDEFVMLATGWHESRQHSDYDGFYSPLLDDKATLVAWKRFAPWAGNRQTAAVSGDSVLVPRRVLELLQEALGAAGWTQEHVDASVALDAAMSAASELEAALAQGQQSRICPSWSEHDRIEFALRDAGFDPGRAAQLAQLAESAPQPPVAQGVRNE